MSFPAGPQPAKNAQEFAISASKTTPRLPSLTADLGQKGDNWPLACQRSLWRRRDYQMERRRLLMEPAQP